MQNFIKYLILLFITIALSHPTIYAQNLLTNGGFESGGSGTGFLIHSYALLNPVNGTSTPGKYAITTNPKLMNSTYNASGDHSTTGNGKMLVVDGANSSNQFFWTTGNTGSPIPGFTIGTNYIFSFWIKSVSNDVTNTTQSAINVMIPVGGNNINPLNTTVLAPLPATGWQQVAFMFTATSNMVMIRLFTTSTSTIGNDFAVDDFSITAGSLPLSLDLISTLNPTCPNTLDGSIIVSAKFGNTPYNYTLTGPKTVSNFTGIFTGLNEGTYDITIKDGANKTDTKQVVLTVPGGITVSPDVATCGGNPTTLTVSGGSGGYTWTASPTDPTLTTPTSATIKVSPSQTTIYTVTSGTPPDPTNFVNNGDFSFGDSDFSTDYIPLVKASVFGDKGAYGIVTNPQTWFGPFDPCPDHTSGSGFMMVIDGSDRNSGNDRLWVQSVAVSPNQDYDFRYYIQTLTAGAPARIEVYINGVSMGVPVNSPSSKCLWQPHTYTWNSGSNTTATITIYDRETSGGGNDFAIDDISLKKTSVCSFQKNVTVTINNTLNLTIKDPDAVCSPATVNITAPEVTAGSTTGTLSYWIDDLATNPLTNPGAISAGGKYYIKNTVGTCSIIKLVNVTINTNSSLASPAVVSPLSYCQNSTASQLTAIAALGATLNWYGTNATGGLESATAPTPSTTSSGKYYVSQSIGTCESPRAEIEVIVSPLLTPTFDPLAAVCQNAVAPILPPNSNNSPVISGTWSPMSVSTATSATTIYTFTPSSGTCYSPTKATISITVNPSASPNFAPITAFCEGSMAPIFNSTSPNGISGTWLPATIDNTSSGNYVFTPNAILFPCAPTQILNVPVTPKVVTTVSSIGSICHNSVAPILPTTSTNSPTINGTWNAPIDTSILGTKTYTFTPTAADCATNATLPITIDLKIIPSFDQVPSICSGASLSALPTASKNGITGNWLPAIDNTKTTTYTFTPNSGFCASTITMDIIVNPAITPSFTPVPAICSGATLSPLPTTSNNGIAGNWLPTVDNTKTTTYTFTPNTGCATITSLTINVNSKTTPLFDPISPICSGATLAALPIISTNGIAGSWTPALDNTKTTTYTFNPNSGICATVITLIIVVNPNTTPTFNSVTPICSGSSLTDLSTTSNNGISGNWSPAIDNTKTTTYTFTPNLGQCATITTTTITITSNLTPTFLPVPAICLGGTLSPLPTTSTNGINGSWVPALDNTTTATYTFTPSLGQCATTTTTTIIINTGLTVTPIFNPIPPSCAGEKLSVLPTTSVNGILGSWSPALDDTKTTIYTFTPNSGQCATSTTITIDIITTPIAKANPDKLAVCSGSLATILVSSNVLNTTFTWNVVQTNSNGAIAGSGDTISQILTTAGNKAGETIYTVTPSASGCPGLPIQITVTINPVPVATATPSSETICSNQTTSIALKSSVASTTFIWDVVSNGVIGAFPSTGETIAQTLKTTGNLAGTIDYTITPTTNGCKGLPITTTINVNPTPEVFGSGGTAICSGDSTNISLSPSILGTDFSWTVFQNGVIGATTGNGNSIQEILTAGTNLGTAEYNITPNLNGCIGKSIPITVTVNPSPTPVLSDGAICLDAISGNIVRSYLLNSGLSSSNYNFKWYFNDIRIDGEIRNSFEVGTIGKYSVIATNKNTGCASDEAIANVISKNPAVSFSTMVSDAFTEFASIQVLVELGTGPFDYKLDDGPFQNSNIFDDVSSGLHRITVRDTEGCTNITQPVTVIGYPKFFTPNGDGLNDTWNIEGLNDQADEKISIYDRYGKLIKQISTTGKGWDGTLNGHELPSTDYWFNVEYLEANSNKLFKAHFSLKR